MTSLFASRRLSQINQHTHTGTHAHTHTHTHTDVHMSTHTTLTCPCIHLKSEPTGLSHYFLYLLVPPLFLSLFLFFLHPPFPVLGNHPEPPWPDQRWLLSRHRLP